MFRVLLLSLGFVGASWPLAALPSFWLSSPALDITARIIADERLRPGAVEQSLARIETKPALWLQQPQLPLARALARLRVAEEAMKRGSSDEADREVEAAQQQLIIALNVTPSDSFLWLMLYSVKTNRNGFDTSALRYLEQSYLAGPHEGWVSLRRNRLAVAIFPLLEDRTQQAVVAEFAEIVDSDFIEQAARTLTGLGWAQKELLLAALRDVDESAKISLSKRLRNEGIDVRVPGIDHTERPWR